MRFPVVKENGTVVECEMLFAFDDPHTRKSFLVYTDNSIGEDGALTLFASAYHKRSMQPGTGNLSEAELLPLENEAEQLLVEAALNAALEA